MDLLTQQKSPKITENKNIWTVFFDSERWIEICEKFKEIVSPQKRGNEKNSENYESFYNISNVCIECRGTYVHPDLVHFVAEWCNIEYAFKVNIIMNNINKLKELEHKDGNEFLETITKRSKNKIKDLEEDNGKKQDKIDELLPEAINQNKELLNEVLNKKKFKNIMSLNSIGGKTKININSLNYLKHNYPNDYKENDNEEYSE